MPTSNWQNISYDIELIRILNPYKILDVGIGFGRWGILSREYLEVWDDNNIQGKWKRTIDGIEIFPPYLKDYHKYFYTHLFNDNLINFFNNTDNVYNLIIFGDVLEHLNKSDGKKVISKALDISDYLIINIPIGKFWEQGMIDDNIYHEHKSIWEKSDFRKLGFANIKMFRDYQLRKFSVIVLSNKKFSLRKLYKIRYGKHFRLKNFLMHYLGFRNSIMKYLEKKR